MAPDLFGLASTSLDAVTKATDVATTISTACYDIAINETPKYRLKKEIIINVRKEHGLWFLSSDYFGINVHGETEELALFEFLEFIDFDFEVYTGQPESMLSEDGIILKNKYMEHFDGVHISGQNRTIIKGKRI